jgi:ATP-dependent Lon protease
MSEAPDQAAAPAAPAAVPDPANAAGDGVQQPATPAIPASLPVLLIGGGVLYPGIVVPVGAVQPREIAAIDEAAAGPSRMIAIVTQAQSAEGDYDGDPQPAGTVAQILRMAKPPTGAVQALLQGVARIHVGALQQTDPFPRAEVSLVEETNSTGPEPEALLRAAIELFNRMAQIADAIPNEVAAAVPGITNPVNAADFIAANANLRPEERYAILAENDFTARLRLLLTALKRELDVLEVGSQIQAQVRGEVSKREREFILREQLRAIQRELGDGDETQPELAELRRQLDDAHLPEEARKQADRELERLGQMSPQAADYQIIRSYLDFIASLPWDKQSADQIEIERAREILDADHFGLEKVKNRILDYLAVVKLRRDVRGPILCLVGPPGVGKTSLGQSIAKATGRVYSRVSLGGVRDEADIRGFRRTYVGALPGRILQEIRRAGVNNPLMVLDEIDKMGSDYRGDPAAAMLEVLDPAQNNSFVDRYLDIPFDLSHVMFITTANSADTIPGPLLDRMEFIELSGYTAAEKLQIARRYLLPRQIEENGLKPEQIDVPDATLQAIIDDFTREAGVRQLERQIGALCRHVARRIAAGDTGRDVIAPEQLAAILGQRRIFQEAATEPDQVGVVTGLAATSAGGDVLFIEAAAVPGKGALTLTGQLGEVMQESARAAITVARSRAERFGVPADFFEKHDLHIHVPAGATPKDGPSAGVTLTTAVVSVMTRRKVRREVAMTGEITLRGRVLPIGGVKQKVLAARRAGCRTVLLPQDNESDYAEVPEDARAALDARFMTTIDEVLEIALAPAESLSPGVSPAAGGELPRAASA